MLETLKSCFYDADQFDGLVALALNEHGEAGKGRSFPCLQEPVTVWQQLLECGFDSWHSTCHPGFMPHQGDCNPLFKVPVKKGFMKVGHSVALVNVYCYSDRVLSGIITFVRPELRAGRHKCPGESCSRRSRICSTCSLQWDLAARKHSNCEHPPCWDFWGDIRMQRNLPTQVFGSARHSERCRKEKEEDGEDLSSCRRSFRIMKMLI